MNLQAPLPIRVRELVGIEFSRELLPGTTFEPIWDFLDQLVPEKTWERFSEYEALVLFAVLSAYQALRVGVSQNQVLGVIENIEGLQERYSQQTVRNLLSELLQVDLPTVSSSTIDLVIRMIKRQETDKRLDNLVLFFGKLYRFFSLDRYRLEQYAAEELRESIETARSHFARTDAIPTIIDRNQGTLRILLPEADAFGRVVATRLTEKVRALVKQYQSVLNEYGLPYSPEGTFVETEQRIEGETNLFASQLLPVRDVPPYRGLDPFTIETRHLFSGRNQEVQTFIDDMLCHRITVMRGQSGIGKTSLVLAGLVPELIARQHFPVVITAQYKPKANYPLVTAVIETLVSKANLVWDDLALERFIQDDNTIHAVCRKIHEEFKRRMPYAQPRIMVIVDQLEAFLLGSTLDGQQDFFNQVVECDLDYNLDVGFLFAIRSEFFEYLEPHKNNIIELYANVRSLYPLDSSAVLKTIEHPAQVCNIEFDEGLAKEVVRDLTSGGTAIVTPQIQIVLTTLFDQMHKMGNNRITRDMYHQLGRCGGILSTFLNREVDEFPAVDRNLVKKVLVEMTTGSGTAATITVSELASTCNAPNKQIQDLMERLAKRTWLIRRADTTPDGETTFRLTHEYLVFAIHSWLEPNEVILRRLHQHLTMLYRSWTESGKNNLFLMTDTQLGEFEDKLNAIQPTQEERMFFTKSVLFQLQSDTLLWEGFDGIVDDNLLLELIMDGLTALDSEIYDKTKRLAMSVVDAIGIELWDELPNLPWHARQACIEVLSTYSGNRKIFEESLNSPDWRVGSASLRILSSREISG